MKKFWIIMLALIVVLGMAVSAVALQVPFNWIAPTQNADPVTCALNGVPLTDLAGYRVGWGEVSGSPTYYHDIDDPLATSVDIDVGPVEDTTIYMSVQAYDYNGNYSCASAEVAVPFGPMGPGIPTGVAAGTPY